LIAARSGWTFVIGRAALVDRRAEWLDLRDRPGGVE
jgi:hypothetical protein